ncbi:glutamine synthetase [Geosporobacter ferrireducens]|uniref:glutamine synthetase n=1 Tax=Geosporobacter ferrireducens TaxID=1424294 RepID=A0A1D8GDX8_9FIRM|nr:glutamine synthetase [Geosporobacter ferrireducens]AOT69108.1 glutamine synthetase [Geosporobacter ferrireducens]MTI56783.1 glutamine synthetase [Geosporobacter ferrireducens]
MLKDLLSSEKHKLLFLIPAPKHTPDEIAGILKQHPEIQFVSLVGIDLGGNDTDEKVPIELAIKDMQEFLTFGVQTDGSSVVLPEIASLNDARVDIIPDTSVNWFVDYNYDNIDEQTGLPVGTLRIPSFLVHNNIRVDSRAILQRSVENFQTQIIDAIKESPYVLESIGIDSVDDIEKAIITSATELEFWVRTPEDKPDIEKLSTSQVLQEQYWKRTIGPVRTALEQSLVMLDAYGLESEMGHKEVGGVKAKLSGNGHYDHVMEQLEIDWKYSTALQAADNELIARDVVKDVFTCHGLDVTFMAKPIEGVAGSGEHTHMGVAVKLKNGKIKNLFSPVNMKEEFMSPIGWGALMGLLKNYEVVNPFVTSSNDALNRLKPGFEAPVCIVSSVGHSAELPSRNRTVLAGLVRDIDKPLATRFELRAPNPTSNTYLVLASAYQAMLDGIKAALKSGKTSKELEADFSKKPGQSSFYLETERAYRSEDDVFEHYTADERNTLFGKPPATVWENLLGLDLYPNKKAILSAGGVFTEEIINSYKIATRSQWTTELYKRIIPDNMEFVRICKKLHGGENVTDLDVVTWEKINQLRNYLMKDSLSQKSLFTRIREGIDAEDFDTVSTLQQEMSSKMSELKSLYIVYKRNLFEIL